MTDLVDQMFPPVNREAHPEFSDFNYWRPPLPKVDLPDFSPPSPPTSAQSGPSKYSLRRITSSITGRTPEVNAAVRSSGRQVSASKPTSPLQAAVLDEEEPDQFLLDSRATKSGEIRRRANSSPDTIMDSRDRGSEVQYSQDDSDSIRKRAIFQRQNQLSDDEGSVLSGEDDDGFPMDDMDFSSVSVGLLSNPGDTIMLIALLTQY